MAIRKTEGIVLSTANWSESSQTITLFTSDMGKISLNVRGGRSLHGKRGRPLRFARLACTCYYSEHKETGYISDIDPVEVFLFERDGQLGRIAFASAAIELLRELVTAEEPQAACYHLTLSFLRMTDRLEKKRLPGLFAGYIFRLISLLGYRPNIYGCVSCGAEDVSESGGTGEDGDDLYFSVERGGLICPKCRKQLIAEQKLLRIPPERLGTMVTISEASLEEASNMRLSFDELLQITDLVIAMLRYHAGARGELKSFTFLDKLVRSAQATGG
jgi:DNA repair protein RecO (recombination protein O)